MQLKQAKDKEAKEAKEAKEPVQEPGQAYTLPNDDENARSTYREEVKTPAIVSPKNQGKQKEERPPSKSSQKQSKQEELKLMPTASEKLRAD